MLNATELIDEDFNEKEWLQVASSNSAFDFLHNLAEDIYTSEEEPLQHQLEL